MRLIKSTTFQLLLFVLFVAAIAVINTDDMTWKDWTEYALQGVFFYAAKESFKYGAKAYAVKKNDT